MISSEVRDMKYYFMKFFQNAENLLWTVAAFFTPVKGILITVGAFIILDTVLGIWKSRVNKVPITSRGLSAIISKMLLYGGCVLVTYLLDFYVLGDILHSIFSIEGLIVKAVALLLVFVEAQSINENYKEAKGIDLWQEFKKLLSRTAEVKKEVSELTQKEDTNTE